MSTVDTNENVDTQPTEENLDDFAQGFFGQSPETPPDPAKSEEEDSGSETEDSDNVDTHPEETDDTLATDDEDADEEVDDQPKKRNRAQERIEELNSKFREEERQRKALEDQIAELKARLDKKDDDSAPAEKPAETPGLKAPNPDEENEDGTLKYPLGEFDPAYIRDTMQHILKEEQIARERADKEKAENDRLTAQLQELQSEWNTKLDTARERYPDFQEKGQRLVDSFAGIDEGYGEYLSTTLMSMEYGADVLYYLANNPEEAVEIVNSGPTRATIALGRLEAKLSGDTTKTESRPKTSKAPPPPPINKGSSAARIEIAPDTDDLDAFAVSFFKKGR